MGSLKVGIEIIAQLLTTIHNKAKSVRRLAILALPLAGLLILGSPGSASADDEFCVVNVTKTPVDVSLGADGFGGGGGETQTLVHESNTAICKMVSITGPDRNASLYVNISLQKGGSGGFQLGVVDPVVGEVYVNYLGQSTVSGSPKGAKKAVNWDSAPNFGGHHLGSLYVHAAHKGNDGVYRVIIHEGPLTDKEKKEIWKALEGQNN